MGEGLGGSNYVDKAPSRAAQLSSTKKGTWLAWPDSHAKVIGCATNFSVISFSYLFPALWVFGYPDNKWQY